MNETEYNRLREASRLRPLTPEEEARLRSWWSLHPEARAGWEEDAALDDLLATLPDVPVSSNFTSRVLAAADQWKAQQESLRRLNRTGWRRLLAWMPKAATVVLVGVFALAGYRILQDDQEKEALALGVELAQSISVLPHPDNLRDFNTIQQLSTLPAPVDFELFEALK